MCLCVAQWGWGRWFPSYLSQRELWLSPQVTSDSPSLTDQLIDGTNLHVRLVRLFESFCLSLYGYILICAVSGGRSVHITDGEETLQIWQRPELDGWRRLLHLSRVWHLYASWGWRRRDPGLSSDSPPVLGIVIIFLCIWLCTQGLMHSARHMVLNLRVMEWLML